MPALVATKLITNTCYTLTSTALKDTLRTFSLTHSQNKKIVSVKQENGSISWSQYVHDDMLVWVWDKMDACCKKESHALYY